jgi:hypothetical protein
VEKRYWIGRKRSALAMARGAATSEARLIHYDLAGRYSVKAAHSAASAPPATGAQRAELRLPRPQSTPSARSSRCPAGDRS